MTLALNVSVTNQRITQETKVHSSCKLIMEVCVAFVSTFCWRMNTMY